MTGKISRLPNSIREQLNLRLLDGQPASVILPWLNALPEVQAVLKEHFDLSPIDAGNLSQYRTRVFRKWQVQHAALQFCATFNQQPSPDHPPVPDPRIEHFVHWITIRLAAIAENSTFDEDPQAELRHIRHFLSDILALRRGELISRRIGLEEQRLSLSRSKHQQELESQFWDWTKRPDIQAKLYPYRDPDSLRRDVVRTLDRELLGIPDTNGHDHEPDPACVI